MDKRARMRLSQVQFARKLSQKTGLIVTRNRVGNWETNKTRIPVHDRKILMAVLIVLYEYAGIVRLDEADRLLEIGGYRTLNDEEARQINPNWKVTRPASPTEQIKEDQFLRSSGITGAETSQPGAVAEGERLPPSLLTQDTTALSSKLSDINTARGNDKLSNKMVSQKSAKEIELYSTACGNMPINLAQQRLLVSTSFGSYFAGLLERPNLYLDLESQIDCPATTQLEGLQPLQRIFWLLGYARGPRTMVIGGEGGMGKSTLSAKIIRCLYQEQAVDLILGDSAKSAHVNPITREIVKYQPGYYDPMSFYNRLCNQLGLPNLPGRQAVEAIKDRLVGRKAIIVMDNLETVEKGDELLNSLKKITSRDVRAIVTTRKVMGVKVLGDDLFVVQLQPLTNTRITEQFLLWHIEQYQVQHSALRDLRKDVHRNIDWLIGRTGGIPLLMQLVLSDVARSSWDYVQTLPSLFGGALLDFLYQAR
ncbi:MAG: AAA family ATPase, partial [Gallionella sp.]|nr:AAA family ATPase [Gallionella sp.]